MNDSSLQDSSPTKRQFLNDVLEGLSHSRKMLPCKYFYDERGSGLFEQICELEEYYLTRTELEIMEQSAAEMADCLGEHCVLIEFGSGSSLKTQILLDHLKLPSAYIPIDISKQHLQETSRTLAARYPHLPVRPICADFTEPLRLPSLPTSRGKNIVYFPGSTIGNFGPEEALTLLRQINLLTGEGGGLLIGFDMKKSTDILESAYNDGSGVTSDFNLNLLEHINRELGANFRIDDFRHHAFFNEEASRIEMHLISRTDQTVRVGEKEIFLARDETIHTENSYKYSLEMFETITSQACFSPEKTWLDSKRYFCIQYLSAN